MTTDATIPHEPLHALLPPSHWLTPLLAELLTLSSRAGKGPLLAELCPSLLDAARLSTVCELLPTIGPTGVRSLS